MPRFKPWKHGSSSLLTIFLADAATQLAIFNCPEVVMHNYQLPSHL